MLATEKCALIGVSMRAAIAVLLFATATAGAVVPRIASRPAADTLTAIAPLAKPLRTYVDAKFGAATGFTEPGAWEASWDPATGVPSKIWGSGIPAFGANGNAAVAEIYARKALAAHLDLLAPGAQLADFKLVSNSSDGEIRSVGFFQYRNGLRVVGGQIGFEFKRDRLFVIGSQALPNVAAPTEAVEAKRLVRATSRLRSVLALPNAPITSLGDEVILPLVADTAVLGYRVVAPMEIDGGAEGRYLAYVDRSGEVVAVKQQNFYATGTVEILGLDRWKGRPRVARPMQYDNTSLGTTADDGTLTITAPSDVVPSVTGTYGTIVDKGDAAMAPTTTLSLSPGGTAIWDESATEQKDAQLNAYVDLNIVKDFVRSQVDPHMGTLDDQLTVFANIAMDCNAFFDGQAINLFHATSMCENTGLVQDVIFHEFGHDLHEHEIIDGVGSFDGAMSEGAGDTLAVNITGDSGMGRGFFYTDVALRELDPDNKEWTWPTDISEIHHTGMIYGGTMWDLRTALRAQYGDVDGEAKLLAIYVGTLRRSVDIPSSLVEALATDDDDGDLSNGTPNECTIRAAYGRHGLRTITGTIDAPGTLDGMAASTAVTIQVNGLSTRCGGDVIAKASLAWAPSYTGVPAAGEMEATPLAMGQYAAQLPLAQGEIVLYQGVIKFMDGSTFTLPDNRADPFYQLYQGHTVPLYCTSMDTNPFNEGWTTGTGDGTASPWAWGPAKPTGGTDPHAAFTGTNILSQAPGGDYPAKSYSYVQLPPIDVGTYSDVRLQYRRWLGVEDSHFDQARILANDSVAWINASDNMADASAKQHIDKEWRFHDVPLSSHFTGHTLNVKFDLQSDPGLDLGGWQLDDLCVVANPASVCGDGVRNPYEQCDDGAGNADAADKCRTTCRTPTCGDHIIDTGEECDDGPTGNIHCSTACKRIETANDSGGCSTKSGAGWLVGLLALLRRRRR